MRWLVVGVMGVVLCGGCSGRRSALLLERHARGPLTESPEVAQRVVWRLGPETQTQEQQGVEVTATFASSQFLQQLFGNRSIFGAYAGPNPYFQENLVFYVKIANRSQQRIRIAPSDFVLTDDRGNQYVPIDVDYITAIAESRQPVATATRGVLEEARPGYFGFSLPVGKILGAKPQGRFALIKQSSLQAGPLYPGVVYDGLIAFWSPNRNAATLRLLVTNLKTEFDAKDQPQRSLEFPFSFTVANQ